MAKRPFKGLIKSPVPEAFAVGVRGRSYRILAEVEIRDPECSGVIFAHGSGFGGDALFVKDCRLHYVYDFPGIGPAQKFVSPELDPGRYTMGMEFVCEKQGEHGESLGKTTLYVDENIVAQGDMRAQFGQVTEGGDGPCIGDDGADAAGDEYGAPAAFEVGRVLFVTVTVENGQYLDLDKVSAAPLTVD